MSRTWEKRQDGTSGWSKPLSDAAGRIVEMPLEEFVKHTPRTVGEAMVRELAEVVLFSDNSDSKVRAFEKLADRTDGKPGMEKIGVPLLIPVLVSPEMLTAADWDSKYVRDRPVLAIEAEKVKE